MVLVFFCKLRNGIKKLISDFRAQICVLNDEGKSERQITSIKTKNANKITIYSVKVNHGIDGEWSVKWLSWPRATISPDIYIMQKIPVSSPSSSKRKKGTERNVNLMPTSRNIGKNIGFHREQQLILNIAINIQWSSSVVNHLNLFLLYNCKMYMSIKSRSVLIYDFNW